MSLKRSVFQLIGRNDAMRKSVPIIFILRVQRYHWLERINPKLQKSIFKFFHPIQCPYKLIFSTFHDTSVPQIFRWVFTKDFILAKYIYLYVSTSMLSDVKIIIHKFKTDCIWKRTLQYSSLKYLLLLFVVLQNFLTKVRQLLWIV